MPPAPYAKTKSLLWPCLALLLLLLASPSTRANIFYVTDTSDTTNLTSLRGAIIAANALGGDNTIVLTNNLYSLTIPGADEDGSLTGDLDITNGNLTILGLATTTVTISATNLGDRVLQIFPAAQATLFNIAFTGGTSVGNSSAPIDGESGGGIFNSGTLVMSDCVIVGNSSGHGALDEGSFFMLIGTNGDAGGLFNSGTVEMTGCVVSSNYCQSGFGAIGGGNGGGICNYGLMTVNNCVIEDNASGTETNIYFGVANGGDGGGIFNTGFLYIINSALRSNNSGSGRPGFAFTGIGSLGEFVDPGGTGGNGGGINNQGTLIVNSCTINDNHTGSGGNGVDAASNGGAGGAGGLGAGVFNSGDLTLNTYTITGNSCGNGGTGGHGSIVVSSEPFPASGGNGGDGGTGAGIYSIGSMTALACTVIGNLGGDGAHGGNADENPFFFNGAAGKGGNGGTGGIGFSSSANIMAKVQNSLIALNLSGIGNAGGQGQTTNNTYISAPPGTNGTPDLSGPFTSVGHNLIGQTNGSSGVTNGVHGDLAGSAFAPLNPLLGPLTNNGGFTATMMPLPGSLAIDRGDDSLTGAPENLQIDQRGAMRSFGLHVDIGAVEYNGIINGVVQPAIMGRPDPEFGVPFGFNAASGLSYTVLASTNLTDWVSIGSESECRPGFFLFNDPTPANFAQRFYQVRQP